ncbi:40S ribosomal protein S5-1 [Hordeum vulgare]|nr:40S ribosomal protein S5-1 [Hordeum vulgare]
MCWSGYVRAAVEDATRSLLLWCPEPSYWATVIWDMEDDVADEEDRQRYAGFALRTYVEDKIFEKIINPYLSGVLQHPQSIEMREGMLHIRDVEGPKKTESMEARLEAMEQQVFKCQGMVERGLNSNHMMITKFTSKHMIDANDIGKHLSRLYDRIDHLQAQIYDVQNQNSLLLLVGPHLVEALACDKRYY